MEFETAKQAAERMGVTVRAIQKWANQGRLPGAQLVGNIWNIPKHITKPLSTSDATPTIKRYHFPLLRYAYEVGKAKEFINTVSDEDDRNIALAEYYYYTGDAEKAAQLAEKYINSDDESLRYSANVMCTFANIFRGHIHLASFFSDLVLKDLEEGLKNEKAPQELHAIGILTAYIGKILLNIPVPETSPLEEYLHYLPQGIRLYGAYILGYKAYKEKNYERAIGICETAFAFCNSFYPIASIYVLIVAAASYMGLKKSDLAKECFMKAWETAKDDGLIMLFGVHHNILQGLTEHCIKYDYPDDYKKIMRIVKEFNDGWYRLHKPEEYNYIHTLEPIEITIVVLYNRDWGAKEIAAHLKLSEITIKKYIRDIYDKLCVTHKKELQDYLEK